MALDGNPWTILGLAPGAPLPEVKRAYRRLAKANHPDTAGEAAIPRFLAIQAAYDALTGEGPRLTPAGDRRGGTDPRRPDPERARATREQWRSRAGRRPGANADAGPRARPGSDAGTPGQGNGRAGAGTTGTGTNGSGTSGGAGRNGTGNDRTGGNGSDAAGSRSASGAPPGADRGAASGPAGSAPGRGERTHGWGRAARQPGRATPGSTSYDFAEHDPWDPEWSGASWYGESSGTYWTINPREYADPRKHGPEYQARARRRAGDTPSPDAAPPADDAGVAWEPVEPTGGATGTGGGPGTPGWAAETTAGPTPPPRHVNPRPDTAPRWDGLGLLAMAVGPRSRVAVALLAWPPLGLALAAILGELSGCGRFSATCVDTFALGTWVGQLAVIGALLLIPAVAAIAAVGTLAVLATAIPAAVVLSALGGGRDPATAGTVLMLVLAVAWAVGVAFGLRRSRRVGP